MILRSTGFQIALTLLLVGAAAYVTGLQGVRSGWNILWMLGVPLALALLLNPDRSSRLFMAFALIGCSLAAVVGVTLIFGFGP